MSWLDIFTIAPKAVDNVLDPKDGLLVQFGEYVNNQNLTNAEVMIQNAKTVANVQDHVKDTMSESTERSKSRRRLTDKWINVHCTLVLLMCIAAPWNMELAEFFFRIATSALMTMGTTAIIIFHYGSYGLVRANREKVK